MCKRSKLMDHGLSYIIIPLRTSKDSVLDNYGRRLLDLCKSTGLIIVNGRLGADKYIGDFTCITPRGQSVMDYFLLAFPTLDVNLILVYAMLMNILITMLYIFVFSK